MTLTQPQMSECPLSVSEKMTFVRVFFSARRFETIRNSESERGPKLNDDNQSKKCKKYREPDDIENEDKDSQYIFYISSSET